MIFPSLTTILVCFLEMLPLGRQMSFSSTRPMVISSHSKSRRWVEPPFSVRITLNGIRPPGLLLPLQYCTRRPVGEVLPESIPVNPAVACSCGPGLILVSRGRPCGPGAAAARQHPRHARASRKARRATALPHAPRHGRVRSPSRPRRLVQLLVGVLGILVAEWAVGGPAGRQKVQLAG